MKYFITFVTFFFLIAASTENCDYNWAVLSLVEKAPARKITKNATYRHSLVSIIVSSSKKYNVDTMLLISTLYRESSFKTNVVGKIGERGMGQVHGIARRGCNLKSISGQVDCSSRWLSRMIAKCGSVKGGMSAYLSGRCKAKGSVVGSVRRRISLSNNLKSKFCVQK